MSLSLYGNSSNGRVGADEAMTEMTLLTLFIPFPEHFILFAYPFTFMAFLAHVPAF